jgi:hypothetical protein
LAPVAFPWVSAAGFGSFGLFCHGAVCSSPWWLRLCLGGAAPFELVPGRSASVSVELVWLVLFSPALPTVAASSLSLLALASVRFRFGWLLSSSWSVFSVVSGLVLLSVLRCWAASFAWASFLSSCHSRLCWSACF